MRCQICNKEIPVIEDCIQEHSGTVYINISFDTWEEWFPVITWRQLCPSCARLVVDIFRTNYSMAQRILTHMYAATPVLDASIITADIVTFVRNCERNLPRALYTPTTSFNKAIRYLQGRY